MSAEQNPPTLASLRGGRVRARSIAADVSVPQQSSLLFTAIAPEPSVPVPQDRTQPAGLHSVEPRILTVAALVSLIRGQVEAANAEVWVEGEISNCRPAPSGHIYLTLKDAAAQLPVVLFRRQAQLLRFRPADGLAVLVRGRVSVYESRGQLQMIAETMEPRGAGSLQIAYEQLKVRLMDEGLFDASRKRSLPTFPRCIGVISSPTGAVIRDIVTVIRRRHAPLHLLLYPAVMQGTSSPASVTRAIRWFNANPQHADLILIARGGGSPEDLACFNDESLARVIAGSKLPVVSAIGHETDFTIADFVADLRAPTPSAAAEIITTAQHRIEDRVVSLDHRLRRGIRLHLLEARQRYSHLAANAVLERVSAGIDGRSQRIDELALRMDRAIHRRHRVRSESLYVLTERLRRQNVAIRLANARRQLDRSTARLKQLVIDDSTSRRSRLGAATVRLQMLSPLNVLARGYALVYKSDGTLLRNASQVKTGTTIRARVADGALTAQVTSIDPDAPSQTPARVDPLKNSENSSR